MLTQFTVLGERCSDTNYLSQLLKLNFELVEYMPHWKHGFHVWPSPTPDVTEKTLYVGIYRNLEPWLESFFREQHHLVETKSIWKFLTQRVALDPTRLPNIPAEWIERERYPSLFALYSSKLRYLTNVAPQVYPHYVLIQYEVLKSRPIQTLKALQEQFDLSVTAAFPCNYMRYKDTDQPFGEVVRRDHMGPQWIDAARVHLRRFNRLNCPDTYAPRAPTNVRRRDQLKFLGSRSKGKYHSRHDR